MKQIFINQDCFPDHLLFFKFTFVAKRDKIMGLPMRITYKDTDYVYEILNGSTINKETTELRIVFDGREIVLIRDDKNVWIQQEGEFKIEPDLAQALGRSVSLRFRM